MDDASGDAEALARAYYRAIDGDGEVQLEDLLAPDFVQERSDTTFRSREAFVQFMREERPDPNTSHEVRACYRPTSEDHGGEADSETERVAVQGRVRRNDGTSWFEFVDVFTIAEGRIERLETYSR
jgi:ketosteroid isomerase-like protein